MNSHEDKIEKKRHIQIYNSIRIANHIQNNFRYTYHVFPDQVHVVGLISTKAVYKIEIKSITVQEKQFWERKNETSNLLCGLSPVPIWIFLFIYLTNQSTYMPPPLP